MAILLLGLFTSPAAAKDRASTYFATSYSQSDTGGVMVYYWSKGKLFRSEVVIAGHPIVTIVNGDWYYIVDSLAGIGVAIKRMPGAIEKDRLRKRPFANEYDELLAAGGEKIRTENLAGADVDVFKLTDAEGQRIVWVTQDEKRLPLRVESYERISGRRGRLDYVTWLPGIVMQDEFFVPAREVELKRFDSYEKYVKKLQKGPIPPAPPLFNYLLHALR